jgi:hypothetical protein
MQDDAAAQEQGPWGNIPEGLRLSGLRGHDFQRRTLAASGYPCQIGGYRSAGIASIVQKCVEFRG